MVATERPKPQQPARQPRPSPDARALVRGIPGAVQIAVPAVAVYVGLEWLSLMHVQDGLPVTPWNPGLGLMLALMILAGTGQALTLFVAILLAELIVLRSSLPGHVMLAFAVLVSASYALVAQISRPHLHLDRCAMGVRDIVVLFAGGLAGALLAATALGLLLATLGPRDIAQTTVPLVLGDVIGIVVVTPFALRTYLRLREPMPLSRAHMVEITAFILVVPIVLAVSFWPGQHSQTLFYLLFLPIVAVAARHGLDGVCAALAFTQLALVVALHIHGFDLQHFTEYQLLMLILTLTGLVVGAVVSERQRADEAARSAAERLAVIQAESARAARLNLVSGMAGALAHEVSQPMTAARALARSVQELLRAEPRDDARLARNLKALVEQIDHAAAVVRRMREFLGRGNPGFATLDLAAVLGEAIELARPMGQEANVALVLSLPPRSPTVRGDRVQLQQVVMNLLRNAVDAIADTGRGSGTVTISVPADAPAGEAQVSVTDDGTGIDAERGTALFEPLSTSRPEGVGLGLWISRTIMEAHGGRIWLHASVPGRSDFRFALPVATQKPTGG